MNIPGPGWIFIILCALCVVSGLLSALVISLRTLSRSKLAALIDEGDERRRALLEAIENDPDAHAAALAIARIFINMLIALGGVYWVVGVLNHPYARIDSIIIGMLLSTMLIWLVSVVVPAGISNHAGERTIAMLAAPIHLVRLLTTPLLFLVRFFDEVCRRLAGQEPEQAQDAVSSEILSVVSEIEREGHIDESERDMLEAVMKFRTTLVESVMTPRTEVDALEYSDDLPAIQKFINEHGHSRVPVYEDNLDHIRGILYAKDLLRWITEHGNNGLRFDLEDLLREPTLVPETKTVRELLTQLLADKVHIAMILDEYGGTSGLITIEDIIEEVFGEIQDEYEDPEDAPDETQLDLDQRSAILDARTEIDDANDDLQPIGLHLPASDDYDTVGGFVNTTLGRIPDAGEVIATETMSIEILDAEPTRVTSLRVKPLAEGDPEVDLNAK